MAAPQPIVRNKIHRRAFVSAPRSEWNGSYREGFREGFRQGVHYGIQNYPQLFNGTSIVIPTYNQLNMLRQCIKSITENTNSPYEIIVVDNASTDGTADYLRQAHGMLRSKILDTNRGSTGVINVGLMMAKGKTIVLLSSETLVTENWLDNMMACLNSDDGIGMVGPVTNDTAGDQHIDVPYSNAAAVTEFARANNQPDASRWRRTDRLAGFCLLFRREIFEAAGYFDEGYQFRNFADDDFSIRVRLLGKSLVIAEDVFVHYCGNASKEAAAERLTHDRCHFYFIDKWNNPYQWIDRVRRHPEMNLGVLTTSATIYPELIAVQGFGTKVYWIEHGQRRQVEGELPIPVTRISQIDLRRWPLGDPISAIEVTRRWRGQCDPGGWDTGIVVLPDGACFHVETGKVRRITSALAMQSWNLHLKPIKAVSAMMLAERAEGLPIISPPMLRHPL